MSTEIANQGLLDAALAIATRRRDTQILLKKIIRARESWDEADRLITELVPDVEKSKPKRLSLVKGE